jgi:hypothetical protein
MKRTNSVDQPGNHLLLSSLKFMYYYTNTVGTSTLPIAFTVKYLHKYGTENINASVA